MPVTKDEDNISMKINKKKKHCRSTNIVRSRYVNLNFYRAHYISTHL